MSSAGGGGHLEGWRQRVKTGENEESVRVGKKARGEGRTRSLQISDRKSLTL